MVSSPSPISPKDSARPRPGGDKIRRITGEDEAQAFHNAKLAQASLPWYLKPEHIGEEIKLDPDGRVIAGTLEALVERLTIEPLSTSLYFFSFLLRLLIEMCFRIGA
jgi:son of sevenless-like protein